MTTLTLCVRGAGFCALCAALYTGGRGWWIPSLMVMSQFVIFLEPYIELIVAFTSVYTRHEFIESSLSTAGITYMHVCIARGHMLQM